MGLPHLERQALVERVTQQETVDEAGIDTGDADNAAAAGRGDALPDRHPAAAFQFHGGQR